MNKKLNKINMQEIKITDEFHRNQVEIQFKHYIINMILLLIFLGVILYIIIDVITDIHEAKMIKYNLRLK